MEDLDITSWWEHSESIYVPEAVREKSEKQKEVYKKAQVQIQRAQKDEKKAKWDNDELFHILTRFIQNPYYESLVPQVTELLTIALPSRPIIGMLSLIYPEAAHYVFHSIGLPERIDMMRILYRYDEPWSFHESQLHESLRSWISIWIDSYDKYLVAEDASLIMQKKFFMMIQNSERVILSWITEFVFFFFQSRNIVISRSTTEAYSLFILNNISKTLENSVSIHPDKEITQEEQVANTTLFGL